jgi:hypothetical protein
MPIVWSFNGPSLPPSPPPFPFLTPSPPLYPLSVLSALPTNTKNLPEETTFLSWWVYGVVYGVFTVPIIPAQISIVEYLTLALTSKTIYYIFR